MANFFSKERIEKRQLKIYKMGRVKSSLLFSLIISLLMFILDPFWDFVFYDYISISNYLSWKGLIKFLVGFTIWYVISYYLVWYDIKSTHKEYHNEKV